MGRMRETSLQELADAKTDPPLPCCGLGESVIFCTIAVRFHFPRIREIRVQKSFSSGFCVRIQESFSVDSASGYRASLVARPATFTT